MLTVEVLEGERAHPGVSGRGAYRRDPRDSARIMEISAVNRLMREGDLVSLAILRVDPAQAGGLEAIRSEPKVGASSVKSTGCGSFDEKIAGMVLSRRRTHPFGLIIAVGVVYNSARIALQERAWELASLRILGFSRAEVSRILLAELALQMLVALPLGLVLAQAIVEALMRARDNETFTIPAVISSATFATAALIITGAGIVSALLVRRRIDRLDLVSVLKTRD